MNLTWLLCAIFMVAKAKINIRHENILNMIRSFQIHHGTRSLVFHIDDKSWENTLKYKFFEIEKDWSVSISVTINQNPMEILGDNERTLHIYLKKELNDIQEWFLNKANMTSDYWLVQIDSQENSKIEQLFSSFILQYTSLVFPFHYSENSIKLWEVYKISHKNPNAVVLNYGNWTQSKDLNLPMEEMWARRQNLQGHFFRASALPNKPYVTVVEEGCRTKDCFQGMYPDIWHNLQGLMNFTYQITFPPDMGWGTFKNGKWNGMIRQLVDDEIDIAPAEFTITQSRSQGVDFLIPIAESHQRLFVVNPAESFNWMAYIEPLLWESWGGVLVGILLLPPIIAAYMSYGKEPNRQEFTLSKCFCFVSGTMAVWSWSHSPNCYHNRIAFYSVLLAGTLIYYHWEAMLISYLAVRTIVLPFNSLEELAYQTDFNVLVRPGTSYTDTFRYGNTAVLQKIWKERIEPFIESMPYPRDKAEINYKTVETGFALFDNYYATTPYDVYAKCQIIDVPVQYFPVQFAYAMQKQSPYFKAFWYQMSKLKENGAFHITEKRYESQPQVCPDYSGKPINFGQCFTAFIVLIAGNVLGFLWCLIEKIIPRKAYVACSSAINTNFRRFFKSFDMMEDNSIDYPSIDDDVLYRLELEKKVDILERQNKHHMKTIRELEKLVN